MALLVALPSVAGAQMPAPWQRTETREACGRYEPFRSPYFGDLHIHTRFSADASIFGTTIEPRQVYDFVTGRASISVSDDDEQQTRSAHIDRPLDFAAVTDHAEFFGEVLVCDPGSPVYGSDMCQMLHRAEPNPADQAMVTVNWLFPAGIPNPPHSLPFCSTPGIDCDAAAVSVWREMQAAAEAAYDRTSACAFTSFVGYEYTASPIGRHLHRNVIFRNEHVPPFAASVVDTWSGGVPQGLWSAIEEQCLRAGTGCDAVIIPHNSNLSGGRQWLDPADATEAQRRKDIEPLVEIHQIKGNSECRFDRLAGAGAGTIDELCTFEQLAGASEVPLEPDPPIGEYPRRNMVRNALEDGLGLEQSLGVNPFQLGFVGGTDTHNGNGGGVDEAGWAGGQGNHDASPGRRISDALRTNPGGLTAVWAEENSRDAVFSALKRRETYATSGTRPIVRFFAGDLKKVTCDSPTLLHDAYARGTPMGGEMGPVRGARSPRFAVWALKDAAGTDLQRIQIVKGWVDADGAPHEQVFDVAGNPSNGADVDPATCAPRGAGAAELCTVWLDPTFDRRQRAFYYARVLENPSCRWSTRVCKAAGVDPFSPNCSTSATGTPFANCCIKEADDPFLSPVIQERAWTSPIWYRPEGIGAVHAQLRFGRRQGSARLVLRVVLGRLPNGLNPKQDEITVRVTDDDDIVAVTLPPGTLTRRAGKRFVGRADGIGKVALDASKRDAPVLSLVTRRLDLSDAERADHMVTVAVGLGVHRATHTRLWVMHGRRLVPEER
jgi:Protein of unknown function (DUF3604)